MPKAHHRRKKGVGRASTRAERRATVERKERQRDEAFLAASRQEVRDFLLKTYGPEPETGYAEWQRHTVDLMMDGLEQEAAEAYTKEHERLYARFAKELFPDIPERELSDRQIEQVWEKIDEVLPHPIYRPTYTSNRLVSA
jgi:hypothetical protein